MSIRRVVVCTAQVPFVRGGAETHVEDLVAALRSRGFETELVSVPFKWYPREEILAHAAAWRLLDLSESNNRPIDLAIGTKFPSYFVRHPNKVAWVMHQYRAAYELCGTLFSDFRHVERDVGLRDRLIALDREMLGECRRAFTTSRTTAARLEYYNGLRLEPLYHPPRLGGRLHAGPCGDYALAVGRLDATKRIDLVVRAMRTVSRDVRLIVAGEGNERDALERLACDGGVEDRVTFAGRVSDEALVELYAGALATVYTPYEEDFGYVTLESFLSRKPVITTADSGGPLEFVESGVNGIVCAPAAEALADAINDLAADRVRSAALGEAGYDRARLISWDGVVDALVGAP